MQGNVGIGQSIRIMKFIIMETGTYNPQWRRSYQTNLDAGNLSAIRQRVAGSPTFSPSLLGGLADNFIIPSGTPEKQILIPNDWGQKRLRFMMQVQTNFTTGGCVIEVIQGYTDYPNISMSGHIDPNMEFYINSIIKLREITENTGIGIRKFTNVAESSHILVNNNFTGIYDNRLDDRMRPEDVFATMSRNILTGLGTIIDTTTTQSNVPVFSNRKNCIPTNFVSDIMSGYQGAAMNNAGSLERSNSEFFGEARGNVSASSIMHDAFIRAISAIQGVPTTSHFKFGDLVRLDPDTQRNTKVIVQANITRMHSVVDNMHVAGMTSDWGKADNETLCANILANAVPALMMELGITGIYFKSSNRDFGCNVSTFILNSEAFVNMDITQNLIAFKMRLEREVLLGISHNNQMDFAIEMKADLLGETWIKISMNGQPSIDYVQPSFADALTVPILSNNRDATQQLAADMELFLSNIIDTDPYGLSQQSNQAGTQYFV